MGVNFTGLIPPEERLEAASTKEDTPRQGDRSRSGILPLRS